MPATANTYCLSDLAEGQKKPVRILYPVLYPFIPFYTLLYITAKNINKYRQAFQPISPLKKTEKTNFFKIYIPKSLLLAAALLIGTAQIHAQELSFKDSIATYNYERIKKNLVGKQVLTGWGLANLVEGGIAHHIAKQQEWQAFHITNGAFGLLNTCSGLAGMYRAGRQSRQRRGAQQAYHLYLHDKRHYLLGACMDVAVIAGGVALTKYSGTTSDEATMHGIGRSAIIQGVALLIFDNVMYSAQASSNARWYRLMDEIRFTGASVQFTHTF